MATLRIAHRGAAGTYPENTLASFRRAMEIGVDGVETDVHRTKDGHLVIIHDPLVDRTTNGTGLVRDLTLEQIKALDAGSWKGSQFAGERIPTLREFIREVPCMLFLELKYGSIHYPGIEEELLNVIHEEGARGRVQISSFDHKALKHIHELDPAMPLGMLYGDNLLNPVALAREVGAEALHPSFDWVTPQFVAEAHAAGLKINTWVANWPWAIAMLKQVGVDGIMSDFPERL